jgi:hypothetical protein
MALDCACRDRDDFDYYSGKEENKMQENGQKGVDSEKQWASAYLHLVKQRRRLWPRELSLVNHPSQQV